MEAQGPKSKKQKLVDQLRTMPRNGTVHFPQLPLVKAITGYVQIQKGGEIESASPWKNGKATLLKACGMGVLLQSFGGTNFCHKRCEKGLEKPTGELSPLRPERAKGKSDDKNLENSCVKMAS